MKIQEVIDYCESLLDTYLMQVPADEITEVIHMLDDVVSDDRLVELPCKVGDVVYQIINWDFIQTVVDVTVVETLIDISGVFIKAEHNYLKLTDYNKTWFTDKTLAEKKLEEIKQ